MLERPSVLCPVDFSEASRGALRWAVALAEHFYASLIVATVNDPLLAHGAAIKYGESWLARESTVNLETFIAETVHGRHSMVPDLTVDVVTGKAAFQIRELAERRHVDVIVMSTHGLTGARKLFLGSTTERVLRETTRPVLVTPATAIGPDSLEVARRAIRCVLAPVDLTDVSQTQVRVATGLAEALGASLVLTHVLEPMHGLAGHANLAGDLGAGRRVQSEQAIRGLIHRLPSAVRPSVVIASGEPADEITRIVEQCHADVIVMALHASIDGGPRMGSVTYQVLTRARTLVVALPQRISQRTERAFSVSNSDTRSAGRP